MTDQQQHLKSAIQQQGELLNEIQTLQNQVAAKRELAVKAQGIIEYLQQVGVTLPEEEAPAEAPETVTPEVESE
tara:strand:+ start:177 stop:398 length:222 start_codon:yes stop_codon:yes gene_type:complete